MQVKYTGNENFNEYYVTGRIVTWSPNQVFDVPDEIGQQLVSLSEFDEFFNIDSSNDDDISGSALPSLVTYSTSIPLDNNKYSEQAVISGATAFTLASGAVTGGQYSVRLVADGTNIPTFSSDFDEVTGSSGYDNTANVRNILSVYYDGVDALYSWTQRIGDTGQTPVLTPPVNTVLPVLSGSVVGDTLTSTNGTWTGNPTPTYTQVFKLDGVEVSAPYTLVAGDVGKTATCEVTGTNSEGSATATSSGVTVTAAPTAPAQVSGLTLGTATDTTQPLSWTAPSDGGSAITDYVIQFSTDDATWSTFADGTSTTAGATVTGLTASTTYYYRVAAVNSVGTGVYSASVSGATAAASSGTVVQFTGIGGATETNAPNYTYEFVTPANNDYLNTSSVALTGDFDIRCELSSNDGIFVFCLNTTNNSTAYNSNNVVGLFRGSSPANVKILRTGASFDGNTNASYATTGGALVYRFTRTGSSFLAYASQDAGATWELIHDYDGTDGTTSSATLYPMIENISASSTTVTVKITEL